MALMSGKKAIMEQFLAEGVEYVFGNPGTTELPFMDALQDYPQIKYILGLQETVAVGAADGYARASGKVGVAQLHITVGVGNGMTMLYDAWRGGTSLVVFAGQQDSGILVQEPGLYSDMVRTTRQFTKWSAEVSQTANLPLVLRRAFKVAGEHPIGPVFLSITTDAMNEAAEVEIDGGNHPFSRVRPDPQALEGAGRLLARARNPIIFVGDGVAKSEAWGEAVEMAELLGARVYIVGFTSEMNFPTNHPLYLGAMNPMAPQARQALEEVDVLLAIGGGPFTAARAGVSIIPRGTRVIQIDVNPWELAKNYPIDTGIQGDPKLGLRDLMAVVRDKMVASDREAARERAAAIAQEKDKMKEASRREVEARWDAVPISGARLLKELQEVADPKRVIVHEAFATRQAMDATMEFTEPKSYFGLRGGGIGWGLPATLGVKLARPNQPVIGIMGDGSAMYAIQSFWTAAHHNIPVVYVIYNNRSYRILKMNILNVLGETARESRFIGMDLTDPLLDFAKLARAFGLEGVRVEDPQDIRPALTKALASGKPWVVDVVVDGSLERPF